MSRLEHYLVRRAEAAGYRCLYRLPGYPASTEVELAPATVPAAAVVWSSAPDPEAGDVIAALRASAWRQVEAHQVEAVAEGALP